MRRRILWIDGLSGLFAGILLLLTLNWLAEWYKIPKNTLFFFAAVNFAYATYSLSIARLKKRPKILITILVLANLTWAVHCLWLAINFRETITLFGLIHLIVDTIYVGGLAYLEWRWRAALQTA